MKSINMNLIGLFFVSILGFNFIYSQTPDSTDITRLEQPESQQIELRTFVESSSVPQNRPVIFHIELSWRGNLGRYQIEPISQPILTNLILEGSGSENRLEPLPEGGSRAIKAFTYRLKPLEIGMAYIDGIVIKYNDVRTNEENKLSSQRAMVEIIEPLPDENSGGIKSIIFKLVIFFTFAILLYFISLYIRKKRALQKKSAPQIPLSRLYLDKLGQEVDPRGTNLDIMISRLSSIFREYLDKDFNLHTRESSTPEILEQLQEIELDDVTRTNLSTVFKKIDEIKFAGKNVNPSEFTNIYGIIEAFLLNRREVHESIESEKKEPK